MGNTGDTAFGRRLLAAVSGLMIFAVAACGSNGNVPETRAEDPAGMKPAGTAWPLTAREKSLLYDAEQAMVQSCMARKGFKVWKVPENPVPEDKSFPYVVADLAWAQRHGYGSDVRRRIAQVRRTDPNRRYLQSLPPQRRTQAVDAYSGRTGGLEVRLPTGAIAGRNTDGCLAETEGELYGGLAKWFRAKAVTNSLASIRRADVLADPQFRESTREWATCMRRHGHRYTDPSQARAAFVSDKAKDQKEEVRTAVDEARCAHSTGLSATAQRLDARYDQRLQKKYRAAVDSRLQLERGALPRARAYLSGH
ncbi:hypothetical protein [Streptomyces sp. NRRL B-24085]|uniref:hypothetical protein n=1 Tax=Streptomyces sp. NRRL B-24085 TaxID=1709476 RepID=UPI0006B3B5AA|nr:hypothetical protein [Streptomyces sp. NRRL B-24085]